MTPEQFAKYLATAQIEAEKIKSTTGGKGSVLGGDKSFADLIEETQKLTKNLKKGNESMSLWKTLTGKANEAFSGVKEDLEQLDKAIAKSSTIAEATALKDARDAYRKEAITRLQQETLLKFGQSVGNASKMALSGMGSFVKGLQGNESGIQLASGLMEASMDATTGGISAFAEVAKAGGAALSTTTGKTRFFGYALEAGATLVGLFAESTNKLAKFGVQVLAKEVEKTVKAFNDAASTGAFFANGMTGLRDSALAAGLTVDQFASVLKQHASDLAATGLGVTEGSKRVGGALRAGGDTMRKQLLNLGYNFEEQAGLVAETMRDMRQSGGPLKASNAEVAAQTAKYAENLRVISAITGEDAKKKEEQVRQQASQLAFQQKLAGMSEQQRIGTMNAMKNMSDMERKNFMDMVNFGTVINQEGAAAAALSPGLTSAVNGFYDAFKQGTLDEISARRISRENTEQQRQDMLNNTAIGTAGAANVGGLVGQIAENMGNELQYRKKWTADAIDAAESSIAAQRDTADKLTKEVIGAEIAAQDLKIALQKELTPAIAQFAKVSREMLGEVQKMLSKLGIGSGKAGGEEPSWLARHGRGMLETGGDWIGSILGAGAAATVSEGLGTLAGWEGGGWLGKKAGTGIADLLGLEQYRLGGISDVPAIFGEKGPEAAVPLPDGNTIPVTMDPQFGKALDLMNAAVNDMNKHLGTLIETQNTQRDIQEQLVEHMRDTSDYTRKLLNVSM